MFVDKKVEYHSVSVNEIYKLLTFTQDTYSVSGSININDSIAPQTNSLAELENTSSYYYNFLRHNFYSDYNNSSFTSFKTNYAFQKKYVLQERARFISIPAVKYGKRIKQGSLTIVDTSTGSLTLTDDGYGNLINSGIDTSSLVSEDSLRCWISFDDAYITKEFPYKNVISLKDNSRMFNTLTVINPLFSAGLSGSGYKADFNGTNYAYLDRQDFFEFEKKNFSISFWLSAPPSQSITSSESNNIISKKFETESQYPFDISVYNQTSADSGKIVVTRQAVRDKVKLPLIVMTSSVTVNDSAYHNICLSKDNSTLKLYIDGTLDATASDYSDRYEVANQARLFLGATSTQGVTPKTTSYFSGSIDEFRIYSTAVTASNLYQLPFNTNVMGSIFYEKGVVALNNLSGSFANLLQGNFTLTYRAVRELTEHEIVIKKGVSEFNTTMNPSIRNADTFTPITKLSSSFADGTFEPYITGIGLYDDKGQLLAIAKLRKPIKSMQNIDIFFKIRFDM